MQGICCPGLGRRIARGEGLLRCACMVPDMLGGAPGFVRTVLCHCAPAKLQQQDCQYEMDEPVGHEQNQGMSKDEKGGTARMSARGRVQRRSVTTQNLLAGSTISNTPLNPGGMMPVSPGP